jgi:rhodanese-related sulfurtransferase
MEGKTRSREISAEESFGAEGALLVDVRSDEEWKIAHIPGALHVPMSQL